MNEFLKRSGILLASCLYLIAAFAQEPATAERPRPCETLPELQQFDFWLGTWDVHVQDGDQAGVNTITKEQGGCVLIERWSSVRGGTGISLNYYDAAAGQWIQNWVSADGSVIDIRGGLQADGSMLLDGFIQTVGQDKGARHKIRGRWLLREDGRVSQRFEESEDGGETWVETFLGFYTRRSAPEAAE